MLDVDEQSVLDFLRGIEDGSIVLSAERVPLYKDELLYFAGNGWKIEVSIYEGSFGGILEIVTADGVSLDYDFLEKQMQTVFTYFPDSKVAKERYGLKSPADQNTRNGR